jgi:polyhydroxybutyrate depolymerase
VERIGAEIGGIRREWLFQPAPVGAPLVMFLAGTGAAAEWVDRETGWSELAAREGFALAVPEALPLNPAAPPSFLANPTRWNDGSEWKGEGGRGKAEKDNSPLLVVPPSPFRLPPSPDVAFLDAILDHATSRLNIRANRVFLTGFSNGAGMTFRFAAERADRVGAIAPVAGYCWVLDPKPVRPVPTLYTLGTGDLLLPLRGGEVRLPWSNRLVRRPPVTETLERWALAIGCTPIPALQSDDGTVRVDRYPGPVRFDAVFVEGLGHHWPGGRAQLNPRLAGPPSDTVNATAMIWEFFRQHLP